MNGSGGRPILRIDVDGVLSLFGFGAAPPARLVPAASGGMPHFPSPQDERAGRHLKIGASASWAGPPTGPAGKQVTRLESRARSM